MKGREIFWFSIGAVWFGVVAVGFWTLLLYQMNAGSVSSPPQQWPRDSLIPRMNDRAALVMLAHPRCPCTRASIGELAWIMTRAQNRTAAYVLFFKPSGTPSDWAQTDLKKTAAHIPGVYVIEDADGIEIQKMRVATSGHTLLFDQRGRLVFSGGITGSRGHSGSNLGRSAVLSLLLNGKAQVTETPVFGCSLIQPNSADPAWRKALSL